MNCKDGVCEIEEDSIENPVKKERKRKKSIEELVDERKHD